MSTYTFRSVIVSELPITSWSVTPPGSLSGMGRFGAEHCSTIGVDVGVGVGVGVGVAVGVGVGVGVGVAVGVGVGVGVGGGGAGKSLISTMIAPP